ncbi:MAG: glutamine synthetase [Thermoproteota archaeon]|jgi:glutamine synthetase
MTTNLTVAEYIWLDGTVPTQQLRCKTRVLGHTENPSLDYFPEWGYDGSSTNQAEGEDSDLILKPKYFCKDPIRGGENYLVLCEVFNPDGTTPHPTNSRAALTEIMNNGGDKLDPWIGFEQEYTFFQGARPLGWPASGYPAPQGPFYCSIGADVNYGREIAEEHMDACMQAGLAFYGINAEVMPGQWEYQIGYRGITGEAADPLSLSDHLWIARYLLNVIAEKFNVVVKIDCKPVKGDWNGAGMHTNFSTNETRDPEKGMAAIEKAIDLLSKTHKEHVKNYGAGLGDRLTGLHETCDIDTFSSGVANRGASIRIPRGVQIEGHGYYEDRRPGANADPYVVSRLLLKNSCGL